MHVPVSLMIANYVCMFCTLRQFQNNIVLRIFEVVTLLAYFECACATFKNTCVRPVAQISANGFM